MFFFINSTISSFIKVAAYERREFSLRRMKTPEQDSWGVGGGGRMKEGGKKRKTTLRRGINLVHAEKSFISSSPFILFRIFPKLYSLLPFPFELKKKLYNCSASFLFLRKFTYKTALWQYHISFMSIFNICIYVRRYVSLYASLFVQLLQPSNY